MYGKINITENHLRILSLFTRGPAPEYYIREVQRLAGISPRTAQLILDDLEKKTVLASSLRGKIRTYRLKRTAIATDYLILAERYKTITFFGTHPVVREIAGRMRPSIFGIAIIFGSYAKGLERKGSDLDLFIVGSYDASVLKNISGLYGIPLSVKSYPWKIFEKKCDSLINEVLDSHVVIAGSEQFVATVLTYGQDHMVLQKKGRDSSC